MNKKRCLSMNKKGHIPTTFLLIASFVLVVYTLFVFLSFEGNFLENSEEYAGLVSDYTFKQGYVEAAVGAIVNEAALTAEGDDFLSSFDSNMRELAGKKSYASRQLVGNAYGRLENRNYIVVMKRDNYVLGMGDVFYTSRIGKNEMKRTFYLTVEFNEQGVVRIDSSGLGSR